MSRWHSVTLGETIGPLELEVTPELHHRWIAGTGNDLDVHRDVVDPTGAGNLAIRVLGSRYPGPIVHSHQDLRLYSPVRAGDSVAATGVVCVKEMRRGKAYVGVDCDFHRRGEPVWWARMTCVWPEVHIERGDETQSARSAGPKADRPKGVPTILKHVTQDDMTLYSGPGNIHSDLAVAQSVGLDATIAQGMMTLAYASELLTRVHGGDWLTRGEIGVRFLAPVYAEDDVTVWVDGETVGAANQDERLVLAGSARLRDR